MAPESGPAKRAHGETPHQERAIRLVIALRPLGPD